MNIIDDVIPEKCSSGTAFASGDDENGNLQDMEVSEGTEGDECTSAPVELLAEFLSAVLQRDYSTALGHCEKILKFEPNNSVAREFWPLISLRIKTENNCVEPESSEEDEEEATTEEDAASNDDERESDEIKFNEEVSDDDEAAEEDPDEESASEMEATSTSDGTTDNFSLGDEEDEHFSNNESKTDPNGNLPDADDGWRNTKNLTSSDHKHNNSSSLTSLDSATNKFQNLTLEQLRAQFVNGKK